MPALQTSRADFFSSFKSRVFVAINRYSFKTFKNIVREFSVSKPKACDKFGKQGSVATLRHKRKFDATNSFPAVNKRKFGATNFLPSTNKRKFVTTNSFSAFNKYKFGATNSFTTTDKRKFVTTNSFSAVNKRKIGVTNSLPSVNKRKFVAQEDIIREFYFVKLDKRGSVAALRQKHIKGADL